MPAELVPHEAIPGLAARVTEEQLAVLRAIQNGGGYIRNGSRTDAKTVGVLAELVGLGLVDPTEEVGAGPPREWRINSNGSRALGYRLGIRGGPFYEVEAADLAAWLEDQGGATWWNVDGDPLLTGRGPFPCPAWTLAAELRRIGRPLLVQAKEDDRDAKGQRIGKGQLDAVVGRFSDDVDPKDRTDLPPWGSDRVFCLCWKGSIFEWLLTEDSEAAEIEAAAATATDG